MRNLTYRRNVIIRSLLLLVISVALLGCVEARYTSRPDIRGERYTHVVHIPGTYVYAVPDIDAEVFFYGGRWYSYHDSFWFRATIYSGPWVRIRIGNVPPRLHKLPGHYRHHIHSGSHRIHRKEVKKHWKQWERDRRWDRDDGHDDGRHKKNQRKKYKKKSGYYKERSNDARPLAGTIKEGGERRRAPSYGKRGKAEDYRSGGYSKKERKKEVKRYKERRNDARPLAGTIKEGGERRRAPSYGKRGKAEDQRGGVYSKKERKKEVKRYKERRDDGRPLPAVVKEGVEGRSNENQRKVNKRYSRSDDDEKKHGKKKHKKKDKIKKAEKKQKKDRDEAGTPHGEPEKESKKKAKRYDKERGGGNSLVRGAF